MTWITKHYCSKPFYISPLWGFNTFVYSIYYQYFAPTELNLVPEGRFFGRHKNRIMFLVRVRLLLRVKKS